ncbi:CbiQ family ECF transporter T component [Neosynechococcus sphagnicola]|uniref:CbiQ family ECF transporter T component n=1 Tax=Neosynechococcus sphagnicola TaxID=1501145 RepID=UPI001EF9CD6C|nr:CbiQ family ECF transporter T component [Neosynechococcus sphagnicola]
MTTTGLVVLGSVTLKALLSLLILNILMLTTSVPALLQALVVLKMPLLLQAILAAMYRYISVLTAEVKAMKQAAIARNLLATRRLQRRVLGNMIGALFIRTYERGVESASSHASAGVYRATAHGNPSDPRTHGSLGIGRDDQPRGARSSASPPSPKLIPGPCIIPRFQFAN